MGRGKLKMLALSFVPVLWLFIAGAFAVATIPGNVLEITNEGTVHKSGHALKAARLQSRTNTYSMDRALLAKSWHETTLFTTGTSAGIEIVCSTCYVNGSVTGELILTGDFNLTERVNQVWDKISNVTETALVALGNYTETVVTDIHAKDIPSWPTIDVDFSLGDVPGLPGAQIHFEFDDLEIYLDLDIKLSAESTYTINIFTSETVAGISIPGLTIGAVFSVDLILIADADIDIGSGIHVKLDDGLSFDMEMFNSNVSAITVPGGSFEFLPVTIQGGEGSIQAILSLQASLGFDMESPSGAEFEILSRLFNLSAGIETDIFAYVADFALRVNGTTTAEENGCKLAAAAEYTMALGAAAGATAAVDAYTWGPAATTTVPVWYTTLASMCATSKTSSASTAGITARAELDSRSTTAVSTVEAFTMVVCSSSGLVNCPAHLQYTTSFKRTVTTDVTVQSGSTPTFPAGTHALVTSAIPFGTNVRRLAATSGSPTSYTPKSSPTSTGKVSEVLGGSTDGVSSKLIIGLCVGLGVPFLIALGVGIGFYIRKRRRYSIVATQPESVKMSPPSTLATPIIGMPGAPQKSPLISRREW